MPDTDDLAALSVTRSSLHADAPYQARSLRPALLPRGSITMDVELYDGKQEWPALLLRRSDELPPDFQGSRVNTHPEGPNPPESAVLHFNTATWGRGAMDMAHGCRGQLHLPMRTLPVVVVFRATVGWRHRIRAEAASIATHPETVVAIGFALVFGHLALVLPDLNGADLRRYWRCHPNVDKRRLIIQVAEALEYLHRRAVLVYGEVTLYLDVFGNTLPEGRNEYNFPSLWDLVMGHGRYLQYRAPEILLVDGHDPFDKGRVKTRESDMYAFGMVVYEILSGRDPWADARLVDIFRHVVSGQLLPRPEDGTIDDSMWQLCTACWNQNPSYRPGIANVLRGLRSEYPPTRWEPDAVAQGDQWLHSERPSPEGDAIPTALDVEIDGSSVNIVLQKQEAAAGGFSTVVKGYSYLDGVVKAYAVKICRGKSVMPREHEIWKLLKNRNILRLLSTMETNLSGAHGLIFVSPYLEHGNLTKFLQLFPGANRLYLMIGVARGLAYLHDSEGIVHGDIKPENILVDDHREALLADFGFSTYVAPGPEETLLEMRQVYTLTYCAPEVLDDTAEDPSHPGVVRSKTRMSDMYAYGVLLYQVDWETVEEPDCGSCSICMMDISRRARLVTIPYFVTIYGRSASDVGQETRCNVQLLRLC